MKIENILYTVIVADGTFPSHDIPLGYIKNADKIVCCDGSVEKLLVAGFTPDAIVGDMDSIREASSKRFKNIIFRVDDQETNDLTKSVDWCIAHGYKNLVIVGATGRREDHTLGNISLLIEYINKGVDVMMVTDTGIIRPYLKSFEISSFPGQQVSIFAIDNRTVISSIGLKYKMTRKILENWWVATLNESAGDKFSIEFSGGCVIVYLKFPDVL